MARGRKKRQKELLENLKGIAVSNNTDLGNFDFGAGFVIGISSAKNNILFYKKKKGKDIAKCIPVNTIRKCVAHEMKHKVRSQKNSEELIDKLELVFYSKDKDATTNSFEFYNADDYLHLNGELQLIKKWEGIVKDSMEFYS